VNVRQLQHLAAAMAHEVRNPLNSMAIHIELLESRLKKEADRPERAQILKSVTTLQGEIDRIDRILEEYLRFAGPEEVPRRAIDPSTVVGASIERARSLAESRGVSVRLEPTSASSSPSSTERWAVDAEGLGEALDALIVNAVEASPRGAQVAVRIHTNEEAGEIVVVDRGGGIRAEDLPRIFQLGFSRRERAGVGLTVAKQIVKGHGGSISAESKGPGEGATFHVRLPLEAEG
jgi:signal transduction histidine kinase